MEIYPGLVIISFVKATLNICSIHVSIFSPCVPIFFPISSLSISSVLHGGFLFCFVTSDMAAGIPRPHLLETIGRCSIYCVSPLSSVSFCKQVTGHKSPHLPYHIIIRYRIFRKIICNSLIILPVKRIIAKFRNNCRYINCLIR